MTEFSIDSGSFPPDPKFRSDSKNVDDESDAYSVVSIANATLVLSIGDTVEEAIVVFLMLQHPLLFLR